jgi:hypothetical protein
MPETLSIGSTPPVIPRRARLAPLPKKDETDGNDNNPQYNAANTPFINLA